MTNNEKFNALLNSCADPRRVYNALIGMASINSNLLTLASATEPETSEAGAEDI